jgi:hypothetical protein
MLPIPGIKLSNACGTDVTILDPQYATWSQANEYPCVVSDTESS